MVLSSKKDLSFSKGFVPLESSRPLFSRLSMLNASQLGSCLACVFLAQLIQGGHLKSFNLLNDTQSFSEQR